MTKASRCYIPISAKIKIPYRHSQLSTFTDELLSTIDNTALESTSFEVQSKSMLWSGPKLSMAEKKWLKGFSKLIWE
jgi:hypothetical protein